MVLDVLVLAFAALLFNVASIAFPHFALLLTHCLYRILLLFLDITISKWESTVCTKRSRLAMLGSSPCTPFKAFSNLSFFCLLRRPLLSNIKRLLWSIISCNSAVLKRLLAAAMPASL